MATGHEWMIELHDIIYLTAQTVNMLLQETDRKECSHHCHHPAQTNPDTSCDQSAHTHVGWHEKVASELID